LLMMARTNPGGVTENCTICYNIESIMGLAKNQPE